MNLSMDIICYCSVFIAVKFDFESKWARVWETEWKSENKSYSVNVDIDVIPHQCESSLISENN